MNEQHLDTRQKALHINLDSFKHGTFAEIGAGQEVVRWFFRVSGAASTIAKTISAYDMTVSDALYGPSDRYVSRRRLEAMLDHEYRDLLGRLQEKRGATTAFFVFADTVAARSYSRHEDGQGWMGVRFQHEAAAQPSEIIIHTRMLDTENVREQEALGVLGVNLLFGAFYLYEEPVKLIASLMDDLARDRIEVDVIKLSGPCFSSVDNRLMSLQLVKQGFTDAAMFTADGEVVQPSEVLYKKPVLVERGSFRPVTNTTIDMLERAQAQFLADLQGSEELPAVIMEMSLRNILSGDRSDHHDFLARVDILRALGKTVMISNYAHYYPVTAYLRQCTPKRIGFVMGIPNLRELFDAKYYSELPGGLLESLGRLLNGDVKLHIYPSKDGRSGKLITAEGFQAGHRLQHLYDHLLENGCIASISNVDETNLHIMPRTVLAKIQSGDPGWETLVPAAAVKVIKERGFFGYQQATARG